MAVEVIFTIILENKPEGNTVEKECNPAAIAEEEPLYKCLSDGKFVLIGHSELKPSSVLPSLSNQEVLNIGTEDWDGWPDGTFERDFTYQEFEKNWQP